MLYGTQQEQPSADIPVMVYNILKSLGIVMCEGILVPRQKKPEDEGYYLKQDTKGFIAQFVFFDGTDYTETQKCETGKIYSVNGVNYVFNGETCKPLGE